MQGASGSTDQRVLGPLLPTPTQVLLIDAAFATDADFPVAWQLWCESLQGALPSLDDYQLLQLLTPRLRTLADDAPYVSLCREQYRLTWAKAKVMTRLAETVIGVLKTAGLQTIILKGAALSPIYYKDPGLRIIGDLDILVAPGEIAKAIDVLSQHGWKPSETEERYDSRFFHAVTLKHPNGGLVDLHGHVEHLNTADGDDDRFWAKAVPFTLGRQQALAIAPAHQLIHQIAHAWNHLPSPRWVADCLTIMRAASIDWTELVETSRHLQLSVIVLPALAYLRSRFGAAVPETALQQLRATETPLLRRRQLRLRGTPRANYASSLEWHCWRLLASARFNVVRAVILAPAYFAYIIAAGGNRGLAETIRKWLARHSMRSR